MSKKCQNCKLVNYQNAEKCFRCKADLPDPVGEAAPKRSLFSAILIRGVVCLCVLLFAIFGFYLSLIGSAKALTLDEKTTVRTATRLIREKGFSTEAMLLDNFTAFRSNDNWLNASVEKENAYAATNFPFEIMTIYPDFFQYPSDDTERAAILLHEARHLQGDDEHAAYKFVWQHRAELGWTSDKYSRSIVWRNVRRQTKENVPELFTCEKNDLGDCTEF